MECRVVCDCGAELGVDGNSERLACENCQALYAVTVTEIVPSSQSNEID